MLIFLTRPLSEKPVSPGPRQLECFAKAILEHPPRWGVIGPSRQSQDPLTCLHMLASHYTVCTKGSCIAYQTAFLIAYFSHLPEQELQELVSALRQIGLSDFLRRARVFIGREAKPGREPKAVYLRRLKEPELRVKQLNTNLQEIKEKIQPGRILATRAWGTRVRICGQDVLVPHISTKEGKDYLSLEQVVAHLAAKANKGYETAGFWDSPC